MSHDIELKIESKEVLNDFISFLNPDSNVDIIFSAPFGAGKTHFLKNDFYNSSIENYNIFHLFPVNYSISSNEDIIELIKFDLLQECIVNYKHVIETDESLGFSSALQISFYLSQKFNIIEFTNGVIQKINNLVESPILEHSQDSLDIIKFLSKEWNKLKTKSKVQSEGIIIDDYFSSIYKSKGIYENDDFTKFIKAFLNKIKNLTPLKIKQNILIIDDLDRIDPEHIFRLFNVFSAQKNYVNQSHKFGFDKVIFVCDINNIRKIYKHRYGEDVDFWGYVSKFVSERVFHFNIKTQVSRNIQSILINSQYNQQLESEFILNRNHYSTYIHLISSILGVLLNLEKISLRDITKISDMIVSSELFYSKKNNLERLILFIDKAIGGEGNFREIINSLSSKNVNYNYNIIGIDKRSAHILFIKVFEIIFNDDVETNLMLIAKGKDLIKIQDKYNLSIDEKDGRYNFKLVGFDEGHYDSFDLIKYLNEIIN